jgi:SAM-dependent MidA family methyltransferase
MACALYDPEDGFYTSRVTVACDYFTSVTIHPTLFGSLLTSHLEDAWIALDRPQPFRVIELGASNGLLAHQIWSAADGLSWRDDLVYTGVEVSKHARTEAEQRAPFAQFVESLDSIGRGSSAVVLSNEVFDALPVRILRRGAADWVETQIAVREGALVFVDRPSDHAANSYVSRYGRHVSEGGQLEMREGVSGIYSSVDRIADRWVMTSIDYGGVASEVHGPRFPRGTLLAYRQHRASEDVLHSPGSLDLTAHVNFSELITEGKQVGCTTAYWGTQADFLTALGVGEYLPALQRKPEVSIRDYVREREAVFQLVSPTDLGRFRVLVQTRGTPPNALRRLPADPAYSLT